MNTCIVYDSRFGNTEQIAQALGKVFADLGSVTVVSIDQNHLFDCHECDLLLLGSPTQGFRATPAMIAFIKQLPTSQLRYLPLVSFDTRIQGPWGSAARHMANCIHSRRGNLLTSPMSFFVKGVAGPLLEGEVERAKRWALSLRQYYQAQQHTLVAR